jgi:hypothetical protein
MVGRDDASMGPFHRCSTLAEMATRNEQSLMASPPEAQQKEQTGKSAQTDADLLLSW